MSVRRRLNRWNLPACLRIDLLHLRIFTNALDIVSLTITRKITPGRGHAKPAGHTDVRWIREVRQANAWPKTRTACFFSYTPFGNWANKEVDLNDGCDRCGWPLIVLITALICQRLQLLDLQQPIRDYYILRYSNVRHAINKRRASPCSWSQDLSSHTNANEIRQRRTIWRQFKNVVNLACSHHTSLCLPLSLCLCDRYRRPTSMGSLGSNVLVLELQTTHR